MLKIELEIEGFSLLRIETDAKIHENTVEKIIIGLIDTATNLKITSED